MHFFAFLLSRLGTMVKIERHLLSGTRGIKIAGDIEIGTLTAKTNSLGTKPRPKVRSGWGRFGFN